MTIFHGYIDVRLRSLRLAGVLVERQVVFHCGGPWTADSIVSLESPARAATPTASQQHVVHPLPLGWFVVLA